MIRNARYIVGPVKSIYYNSYGERGTLACHARGKPNYQNKFFLSWYFFSIKRLVRVLRTTLVRCFHKPAYFIYNISIRLPSSLISTQYYYVNELFKNIVIVFFTVLIVLSFYDRVATGSVHADITSFIYNTHTAPGIWILSSRSINLYAVKGTGVGDESWNFSPWVYWHLVAATRSDEDVDAQREPREDFYTMYNIYIFVYYILVETVVGPGGRSRNTSSGCGQRPMQVPPRNEYEQRIRK